MDQYEEPPSVNFVPCIKWIRRGVAKNNPIKVELTKEELKNLVKNTKKNLTLNEKDEESNEEENENEMKVHESANDELDLSHYDQDDTETRLNIEDIAVYEDNDPYHINEDNSDSDSEDDYIKNEDNLIVVGHVEGYASSLEIYVFNDFEDSLYVHHDILLPSIPLCIEWLNYDPKNVNRAANLCAVGNMSPIIDVWDIDIVNSIEPSYRLGKKSSKKKGTARIGHKDAVLDLSWNINLTHILASGSADQTVLLWDLERKQPHTCLNSFEEKVQSIQWHPVESEMLLAGSCDRTNKVFNCQTSNSFKSWEVEGEVERVLWNHFNPYQFLSSDSKGFIYAFDCRQDGFLWKVLAHSKEVTGLTLSSQCPGFLATASQDNLFKVWDIFGDEPTLISERNLKIGDIQCLENAPDDPFLMASGGDKRNKNFFVFSAMDNSAVQATFRAREMIAPSVIEGVNPNTSEPPKVHPVMKNENKLQRDSLKLYKKKKNFKKQ